MPRPLRRAISSPATEVGLEGGQGGYGRLPLGPRAELQPPSKIAFYSWTLESAIERRSLPDHLFMAHPRAQTPLDGGELRSKIPCLGASALDLEGVLDCRPETRQLQPCRATSAPWRSTSRRARSMPKRTFPRSPRRWSCLASTDT